MLQVPLLVLTNLNTLLQCIKVMLRLKFVYDIYCRKYSPEIFLQADSGHANLELEKNMLIGCRKILLRYLQNTCGGGPSNFVYLPHLKKVV